VNKLVNLEEVYATAKKHADSPRNMRPMEVFSGHAKITGPCGTTMEFWVKVQKDKIKEVSFITDGCASSIASGSMATCMAEGRTIAEAQEIDQQNVLQALDGLPKDHEHCALLSTNTLKAACEDYLSKGK
jgi:nitrogen fixation NifU-like protein